MLARRNVRDGFFERTRFTKSGICMYTTARNGDRAECSRAW